MTARELRDLLACVVTAQELLEDGAMGELYSVLVALETDLASSIAALEQEAWA